MNLPESFLQSLEGLPGLTRESFINAHEQLAPVSIRLNPEKYIISIAERGTKVPWCEQGIYLSERPLFTLDPLFHAGCYYVQEASSMMLDVVVKKYINQPVKALDLCAAPGGKSTLLYSSLPAGSLLVSNEVIKTRVGILEENLTKWGVIRSVVTQNDPRDFEQLPGYFDVVVVDAPCSGSGLFRKDPSALQEWSESAVALCAGRQHRILSSALETLKPGGLLIYSTCSYSQEEDEAIILEMLGKGMELLLLPVSPEWHIYEGTNGGGRFWPHQLQGEGFFIAVFRKPEGEETKKYKEQVKWNIPGKSALEQLKQYVVIPEGYTIIQNNDDYILFPEVYIKDLAILAAALYIKKSGVKLGRLAGKDFIPDPELAWSGVETKFPKWEMSESEALAFLRKQTQAPPLSPGWYLATHEGMGLGWIKVMAGRSNNYYPKEWRILK